jgi:tetratricopeptide (TPR) repeat protein
MFQAFFVFIFFLLVLGQTNPIYAQKKDKKSSSKIKPENEPKLKAEFIKGAVKLAQNYPDEALQAFEEVLKIAPGHTASLYNIAKIYAEKKDYARALPYAEKALKADPNNIWYYLLVAAIQDNQGLYGQAAQTLEKAIKKFYKELDLKMQLAEIFIKQKKYNAAIAQLDSIEYRSGVNETCSYKKKDIYLNELSNPAKAIEELRKLINASAETRRYYYDVYIIYRNLGQNDKAIQILEEVYQKYPYDSWIVFNLIEHYKQLGKVAEADKLMEKAMADPSFPVDGRVQYIYRMVSMQPEKMPQAKVMSFDLAKQYPTSSYPLSLLAYLYTLSHQADSARFYYKKATYLEPTNQALWEQLLNKDYELGKNSELVQDAEAALEVFPDNPGFMYFAGLGYYQQKNYKQAIQRFEKYLKYVSGVDSRNESLVLSHLGDCYYYLGNYEKSDANFKKAFEKDPNNTLALNNYAYFLSIRQERLEEAILLVNKALALSPNNPSYLDTKGWILYQQKKYAEAKEVIEQAYQFSQSAEIAEHLGDVYYQLGDIAKAMSLWKVAKERGGNSESLNRKINTGKL